MNVEFEVSDEYVSKVEAEIRKELTPKVIEEEVKKFLANNDISLKYVVENYFELYERLKSIKDKKVSELDGDDRFIIALYGLVRQNTSSTLF